MPPGLVARVELLPGGHQILAAFFELSTDRQLSFSEGPIPFTAIDAYARRMGIDGLDEFMQLRRLIRTLDASYLKRPKAADPS
ncbi:hypothetical protein [Tianweitania sp.]|uniref:phage tail assembly chaperone n=1 Tax=Tianweitania sp. TaxID=2021634 RepID=UPI00289FCC3F|nr:hypothetical protein [Tianweitania sp.]